MIQFSASDAVAQQAIREVFREIPETDFPDCVVTCVPTGHGLIARRTGAVGEIRYCDRCSLLRGVTLFAQKREQNEWEWSGNAFYETLCAMPDVSRNAVPKPETLKKFFRLLAMEGYNAVMLYTEDTYELPGYPYFGHLRGRYTREELKDLDNYANLLGLEMIPAIQTLAHLNGFFEWPASQPWQDCNDILLVGEEKVYQMIEDMLILMKQTLRSRRVNIGMDEAFLLGAGNYLNRNGYLPRYEIMLRHLSRVVELCKKHGYEPRMWSDMFFRTLNNGVYRVPGTVVPPDVVAKVPPEVVLVYWDYYQTDPAVYDEMFRQHRVFPNKIAFAGGDSSWYGPVPLNLYSKHCFEAAAQSIQRNGIDEVYVTMWGDDGGACSLFSSLNTIFAYGEACWGSTEDIAERLKLCTGMAESELLDLEELYRLPERKLYGKTQANPGKYIFYANILTGKFDCHIPDGSEEHLKTVAHRLAGYAQEKGQYQYLFCTVSAFAEVLAEKAELGKALYRAYQEGDRAEVKQLTERIPVLCGQVQTFRRVFRTQWMKENKSFGFDVMDIRIGGLLAQLDTAELLLWEWLNGERTSIDELETPRLPYGFPGEKGYDNGILLVNRWERIAGQNISNMF